MTENSQSLPTALLELRGDCYRAANEHFEHLEKIVSDAVISATAEFAPIDKRIKECFKTIG